MGRQLQHIQGWYVVDLDVGLIQSSRLSAPTPLPDSACAILRGLYELGRGVHEDPRLEAAALPPNRGETNLRTYVSRTNKRFTDLFGGPKPIERVRGVGYQLVGMVGDTAPGAFEVDLSPRGAWVEVLDMFGERLRIRLDLQSQVAMALRRITGWLERKRLWPPETWSFIGEGKLALGLFQGEHLLRLEEPFAAQGVAADQLLSLRLIPGASMSAGHRRYWVSGDDAEPDPMYRFLVRRLLNAHRGGG